MDTASPSTGHQATRTRSPDGDESNDIELRDGSAADQANEDTTAHSAQHLPPTDHGPQAYLLLFGCFTINILIWGFAFSFGVLQEHYTTHSPFASQPAGIATIGTVATGLMYFLMPLYFTLLQRYPLLKRWSVWLSVPVVAGALIGASFAQTVSHLIATQGVLFALGGNLIFCPTVTYLDEWFVRRKGLAIGIMWAGDGVGGVAMPLILETLLARYGFRVALRSIAVANVVLLTPLLYFLKPRLPTPAASSTRPIDIGFLRSPYFWTLQAFNIVQALGYFLPSNYLPTYAQSLGLSSRIGSLMLVLINLAAVFGCVAVGFLVDRVDVLNVVLGISVVSAVAVFAVWGLSTSLPVLAIFALGYGLTAGAYSCAWTGMIKNVQQRATTADANVVFGFLAAGRGLGATASGPLSEALVAGGKVLREKAEFGYGSEYGALIIFSGCTALVGGCSWAVRQVGFI